MVVVKDLQVLHGSGDEVLRQKLFYYHYVIAILTESRSVLTKNPEIMQFKIESRLSKNASSSKTRPRPLISGLHLEAKTYLKYDNTSHWVKPLPITFKAANQMSSPLVEPAGNHLATIWWPSLRLT